MHRIGELEAENNTLRSMVADVIADTGDDPEIMAASRAEWAARALAAEAKLARAVDASVEAVWAEYTDSIESKWAFRKEHVQNAIARTLAELKGQGNE